MKDFGRHVAFSGDMDAPVVGITGESGAGKSTLLQALQFGITGKIDHTDALGEFIRASSDDKAPKRAEVHVEFICDGRQGKISRHITASKTSRELSWDGKQITSDKSVASTMQELLGVDADAVNSTVFIKQGEFRRMFGLETLRRKFYTKLLMVGHLEPIAEVVDRYRKQVADNIQDLTPALDASRQALDAAIAAQRASLALLESSPDPTAEVAKMRELVAAVAAHGAAETRLAAAKADADSTAAEEIDRVIGVIDSLACDIDQLMQRSLDFSTAKQADQTLRRWLSELESVEAKYAAVTAAREAIAPLTAATAADRVASMDTEIRLLRDAAAGMEQIATCEASIEACTAERIQHLQTIRQRTATLQLLTEQASAAEQKERDCAAESSRLSQSLVQGTQLLSALTGHQHGASTTQCPVCGSASASSDFLRASISRTEQELAVAASALRDATAQRATADHAVAVERGHLNAAQTSERSASDQIARYQAAVTNLRAKLVGVAHQDAASCIAAAEAKFAERNALQTAVSAAGWAERELSNALRVASLAGFDPANASATIVDVRRQIAESEALLGRLKFDESDRARMLELQRERDLMQQRRVSLESTAAHYSAALAVMRDAEQRRNAALNDAVAVGRLSEMLSAISPLTHVSLLDLLRQLEEAQQLFHQAQGALDADTAAVRNAHAQVETLVDRIEKQGDQRKLVEELTLLQRTLRPDGASLDFLRYCFERIAARAADYLAESGADFMVTSSQDDPLAFEFLRLDRPGEVWLHQDRMSGGQQVRLAVATLLAIHELFMPNVGLLVLDEPSTHLSTGAVEALADMLSRIGSSSSLQIIVCDHNPALIDAFSKRIHIS